MLTRQSIELTEQLEEFARHNPEVDRCAIISTTGIMIAGYNINWESEDKFAAICTANFGLLSRSSRELAGKMQHFTVQIEGKQGTTILMGNGRQIAFISLYKNNSLRIESLIKGIQELLEFQSQE